MSGASERAYEKIRTLLIQEQYAPGSRLSESELSQKCGVSRTPVREALRRLALEYFVRIEPNRGAFVIDWSREDIIDMFEMRSMMEGLAARKAAERATPKQILGLSKIVIDIEEIANKAGNDMMSSFLSLNREFHEIIFAASGSPRLKETISRFVEQAVVVRTAAQFTPEDVMRSNQHHKELVNAIKIKNGVLAESIMRVHILAASSRYYDGYMPGGLKGEIKTG
ncbi:GntR family transcriptional regulator [Hellea sp.]|jgi:DNA-binding GntR family transcriptional regulator|nr:GntR family transcriptional regulator [Hellea sp.]MDA8887499.1 GntR family transcriptional regulator [Hellea sp.]MDB4845513.1 GntR family transcriptional regulator [Hellea sp.]MDC0421725.1 GntR family transcriptional regulator [Hellea sp.]MDC0651253.1 GntR family transcriptional regulator [Hellea sp.]MDC1061176.1 GntR family transcriptional regulator [Hellea sp.]